jgi:hypothetical protein
MVLLAAPAPVDLGSPCRTRPSGVVQLAEGALRAAHAGRRTKAEARQVRARIGDAAEQPSRVLRVDLAEQQRELAGPRRMRG